MTSNYEVISKKQVSVSEVLDDITKKSQEVELTYREEKIREFLKKHNKISYEEFLEIKKKIEELSISRLEEEHIIRILDIMPSSGTQLRSLIQNTGIVLVDETANNILTVLEQYRK